MAKWSLAKKEFTNIKLNDILYNWIACMVCSLKKARNLIAFFYPPMGVLKFDVDFERPKAS